MAQVHVYGSGIDPHAPQPVRPSAWRTSRMSSSAHRRFVGHADPRGFRCLSIPRRRWCLAGFDPGLRPLAASFDRRGFALVGPVRGIGFVRFEQAPRAGWRHCGKTLRRACIRHHAARLRCSASCCWRFRDLDCRRAGLRGEIRLPNPARCDLRIASTRSFTTRRRAGRLSSRQPVGFLVARPR